MSPATKSTEEVRYDGQVAIVTGAGRGMGYEHALLLAKRGAKIVLNDINPELANSTVDKIRSAGGEAVAVIGSVAEHSVGEEIVKAAVDVFGRIDMLINNAGILIRRPFEDITSEQLHLVLGVHLIGSWNLSQLCWPHMKKQKYGRIVMICSTTMYGAPEHSAYMVAKGGLFGLCRSLALEGKEHGILVNCMVPSASTEMSRMSVSDEAQRQMMESLFPASATSPVCAWLAHKDCHLTGELITAFGPRFGKIFIAETPGYASTPETYSIETVRDHMDEARNEKGYVVPTSTEEQTHLVLFSGAGASIIPFQ